MFAPAFGLLLLICSIFTALVNGANILGVFTSFSPSHLIVNMGVVAALAERGHNVTVVCNYKPKLSHERINVIHIPYTEEDERSVRQNNANLGKRKNTFVQTIWDHFDGVRVWIRVQYNVLKSAQFQQLYGNRHNKFDLVISGYFYNDFQLGVAAMFKCPLIVSYMMRPNQLTDALIGNPDEIAYVPTVDVSLVAGERMSFLKRLDNLKVHLAFRWLQWRLHPILKAYYNDLFPQENFPSFEEMKRNVSLIFYNNHFSEGFVRPHVPGAIEIGGIQIREKPAALPADIAQFLGNATNGAIFFSLGSNLQLASMVSQTVLKEIFAMLANLKQKVIWKWDDLINIPGKSANILYKQWLPQDDILAHPNLKLFLMHAGKGGIAEAQYHGVPMIALPAFADQHNNAEMMVESGYGLELKLSDLTGTKLRAAIEEVLHNPIYTQNIKRFSELYRDRPLTAKQSVGFWTEYVLRHHGAAHMQSPLVHLNFIEAANLDILALFVVMLYALWKLLKFFKCLLLSIIGN